MTSNYYAGIQGAIALITGGASGIGAAHVRAFARNGARVAFLDIQDDHAHPLAEELNASGAMVSYFHCDLLDLAALEKTVEKIRDSLGPVSALINNAAVDQRRPFDQITADDFEWMMNANLRHAIFTAQKVAHHMKSLGGGSIVNTSSVAFMRGLCDMQLYSAAKAAIVGFTNSLARELGPDRIRVNAIAPGYVSTPRQRSLWHDAAGEERMRSLQCLPDAVEPHDVAELALFLCSDAGRMITKQCIAVNGGSL